jgi:hypothetical protein
MPPPPRAAPRRPFRLVGQDGAACLLRRHRSTGLDDLVWFGPHAHLHPRQPGPTPV